MRRHSVMMILAVAAALGACVTRTHQEAAARRMPWPEASALPASASPTTSYPSVGGDTLKGASPADQDAVRAAAEQAPRTF